MVSELLLGIVVGLIGILSAMIASIAAFARLEHEGKLKVIELEHEQYQSIVETAHLVFEDFATPAKWPLRAERLTDIETHLFSLRRRRFWMVGHPNGATGLSEFSENGLRVLQEWRQRPPTHDNVSASIFRGLSRMYESLLRIEVAVREEMRPWRLRQLSKRAYRKEMRRFKLRGF